MNTNRITINELKNVGNWFQNHFNSLIIDKIYCHIDFELGFWHIKSATGDKILKLKISSVVQTPPPIIWHPISF